MNNMEISSWCETTPKDRANGHRVTRWSLAWAEMMLAFSAASSFSWVDGRIAGLVGAVLAAILGVLSEARHICKWPIRWTAESHVFPW